VDPLSDILELVGFRSSIYFQKDFCGRWKMSVADTGFAQFHFVISGTATLQHDGQAEHLSAGDFVLFPHGASHTIGDRPDTPAMRGQDVIAAMLDGNEPFTDGQDATRMVCGHFQYDLSHRHPLMQQLPSRVLLRPTNLIGTLMSALLPLIVDETRAARPGSRVVAKHLSQALFAAILRAHFEQEDTQIGFYAGLRDSGILAAIMAIHQPDGWKYSMTDLAGRAGMSRSSFAARFKALVGQSPGDYALGWKMLKAKEALQDPRKTIDQIAHDHGYGSASAFSRAFRETLGLRPSEARELTNERS
jgi:AraC-like DNA-binding protein